MLFIFDNRAYFGVKIPLNDFQGLAQSHISENPKTLEIEEFAHNLIQQNFPEQMLRDFIKQVCVWGNFPGIYARIINQNDQLNISRIFNTAANILAGNNPDIVDAMTNINNIKQLGSISFASKHLRFLCPKLCPVYDSKLNQLLPYSYNVKGYVEFAKDCLTLAGQLEANNIENPFNRPDKKWYATDVEAAIFMYAQNLYNYNR